MLTGGLAPDPMCKLNLGGGLESCYSFCFCFCAFEHEACCVFLCFLCL